METTKNTLKPFTEVNTTAPAYWAGDILWIVKAAGNQTGGLISMIEQTMPYGAGPPPHKHPDMDEMFYVLEGEITIVILDKIYIFKAGTFGFIPRDTVHYFKITSKENCRALNFYTPSGFEESLAKNSIKAESLNLPPKGIGFPGKGGMHIAVNIKPIDLMDKNLIIEN